MTRDEIVDLAIRIGQWAEKNFDTSGNPDLHVILPLLGIVEELGEAEGVQDDELRDAAADAAIYALDLIYRICGGNRQAIETLVSEVQSTSLSEVMKPHPSYIFRPVSGLAHAFLKRIQGIRLFDNDEHFRKHVRVCLARLFYVLSTAAGCDIFQLAWKVFNDIVSLRDWKANPRDIRMSDETIFSTGAKRSGSGAGVRFDLIPPHFLAALAATFAEGAAKYGEGNWQKGIPNSNLFNHAMRHLVLYQAGDASEPHLAHAAWNIMAMMVNDMRIGCEHLRDIPKWDDMMDVPCRNIEWRG